MKMTQVSILGVTVIDKGDNKYYVIHTENRFPFSGGSVSVYGSSVKSYFLGENKFEKTDTLKQLVAIYGDSPSDWLFKDVKLDLYYSKNTKQEYLNGVYPPDNN